MLCEVCGREVTYARRVLIEGSVLRACEGCQKFGREIDVRKPAGAAPAGGRIYLPAKKPVVRDIYGEMGDTDLANDFGARIRSARNAMSLKQEELGKKINERKSVIEQLENGRIRPDDRLVAKLEKALGVKLKEKVVEEQVAQKRGQSAITLGDLIKDEGK